MFLFTVIGSIALALVEYFCFDWEMRSSKTDLKHFTYKQQRICAALFGIVFLIPIVVIWIFYPQYENAVIYIFVSELVASIIYTCLLRFFCRKELRHKDLKEKISYLGLSSTKNIELIKEKLKSCNGENYSEIEIKKALDELNPSE